MAEPARQQHDEQTEEDEDGLTLEEQQARREMLERSWAGPSVPAERLTPEERRVFEEEYVAAYDASLDESNLVDAPSQ